MPPFASVSNSIKLNIVAVKGLIEPDIIPMAHYCRERGFEPRFIEFMPLDSQSLWDRSKVLRADDIIAMLSREIAPLVEVPDRDLRAPATDFAYADGGGKVGFVASVSKPFCLNCNRLRLTSDGKMRYCLFAIEETDVKHLLRSQRARRRDRRGDETERLREVDRPPDQLHEVRPPAAPHVFHRRLRHAELLPDSRSLLHQMFDQTFVNEQYVLLK